VCWPTRNLSVGAVVVEIVAVVVVVADASIVLQLLAVVVVAAAAAAAIAAVASILAVGAEILPEVTKRFFEQASAGVVPNAYLHRFLLRLLLIWVK
jgi:hypothetical protein